ncbi:MAG: hypothetical protein WDN46_00880 [Methylocella sp.]
MKRVFSIFQLFRGELLFQDRCAASQGAIFKRIIMTKPKIIFHIGLERTGTTSFQRYCTNNKNVLLKYSLLYPTKNAAFSVDCHGPLVSSYLQNDSSRDFSLRSVSLKRSKILRSLLDEINKSQANTVLLSSEHFSSRFGEEQIQQLAADFAGCECRIFVTVRDHLARLCSSYSTSVMSGSELNIEGYAANVTAAGNKYIRVKDTVTPWAAIFGKKNISVFCYRPGENVVSTLCESLVAGGQSLPAPSSYADNRSLGPSLTEALRLTNIALSSRAKSGASQTYMKWLLQRYFQVCLKRWLARASGDQLLDSWRLPEDTLRRLNEIAEIDCRWLEDEYGVRLSDQQAEDVRCLSGRSSNPEAAGEILAKALVEQAMGRRWDVIDAAVPILLPLIRVYDRWRILVAAISRPTPELGQETPAPSASSGLGGVQEADHNPQ